MTRIDPILSRSAAVFALCAAALVPWAIRASIGAKPLRFAVSIAVFLGTMALITPLLAIGAHARSLLSWVLVATMSVEFAAISLQAARGTSSHFNVATRFDASVWGVMVFCIVVAVVAMTFVAIVASSAPLSLRDGSAREPLAFALRAGLWIFLLAALSGFAMGGRGSHSVPDAIESTASPNDRPSLAIVQWNTARGDLRISHFFALHALQALPLVALMLARLPLSRVALWTALFFATALFAALPIYTFVRALSGRTPW